MITYIQVMAIVALLQAFGVSPATIQMVQSDLIPQSQTISQSTSTPILDNTPIQQTVGASESEIQATSTCVDNNPILSLSYRTPYEGETIILADYRSTCPMDYQPYTLIDNETETGFVGDNRQPFVEWDWASDYEVKGISSMRPLVDEGVKIVTMTIGNVTATTSISD